MYMYNMHVEIRERELAGGKKTSACTQRECKNCKMEGKGIVGGGLREITHAGNREMTCTCTVQAGAAFGHNYIAAHPHHQLWGSVFMFAVHTLLPTIHGASGVFCPTYICRS